MFYRQLSSFILLCLILFASCRKEEDMSLEFKGIVLDYQTMQPYPNTRVILQTGAGINVMNGFNFTELQIDSVRTNSNGQYSFFEDSTRRYIYRLEVRKSGYMQLTDPLILARTVKAGVNTDTLFIGQSSSLLFQAYNDDPFDGDELTITFRYHIPSSPFENQERITFETLSEQGLNPQSFRLEREYFAAINPTLTIDLQTMRIIQGDPVYTNQTLVVELSPLMTKTITYEF